MKLKPVRLFWAVCSLFILLSFRSGSAASLPLSKSEVTLDWKTSFANTVELRFLSACRVEDENKNSTEFVFVECVGIGGYLLLEPNFTETTGVTTGVPIREDCTYNVSAEDRKHCILIESGSASVCTYEYEVDADRQERETWILSRYTIQSENAAVTVETGDNRMIIREEKNGAVTEEKVAYAYFREGNNIDYARLPKNISEAQKRQSEAPVAIVSTESGMLNVRARANIESERVAQLYTGAVLRVLGMEGKWAHIRLSDGDGYVDSAFLRFGREVFNVVSQCPVQTVLETCPVCRFPYERNGQDETVQAGQRLTVVGIYNSNWSIVAMNGGMCYIRTRYLSN